MKRILLTFTGLALALILTAPAPRARDGRVTHRLTGKLHVRTMIA